MVTYLPFRGCKTVTVGELCGKTSKALANVFLYNRVDDDPRERSSARSFAASNALSTRSSNMDCEEELVPGINAMAHKPPLDSHSS